MECADPFLLAHLAHIKASPVLQVDFENSITLMLPSYPVAKKVGKNESNQQADVSSIEFKKGIGQTGVEFRYYPPVEYALLSDEKMAELGVWRRTEEGKADKARGLAKRKKLNTESSNKFNKKKQKKAMQKQTSSAVAAERKKHKKHFAETNALVSSLVQGVAKKSPPLPPPIIAGVDAHATAMQLQTIMRKYEAP